LLAFVSLACRWAASRNFLERFYSLASCRGLVENYMQMVLRAMLERCEAYSSASISTAISPHEDMYAHGHDPSEAMGHYLSVGQSAIEVIAKAMIEAGKTDIGTVLDLPCGGGRVTRHLAAFLPQAELFVGDVNTDKVKAVVAEFGAEAVDPGLDFSKPPIRRFDLIWVGSLFTHLNDQLFGQALRWYLGSLAPDGLLVMTTHGRRHEALQQQRAHVPVEQWAPASASFHATGFGFVPYDANKATDPLEIGTTVNSPSWLMRLVETDPSVRVIAFQEGGWVDAQDVLVMGKRPI
jgi:SAM-dependent methyltransferase